MRQGLMGNPHTGIVRLTSLAPRLTARRRRPARVRNTHPRIRPGRQPTRASRNGGRRHLMTAAANRRHGQRLRRGHPAHPPPPGRRHPRQILHRGASSHPRNQSHTRPNRGRGICRRHPMLRQGNPGPNHGPHRTRPHTSRHRAAPSARGSPLRRRRTPNRSPVARMRPRHLRGTVLPAQQIPTGTPRAASHRPARMHRRPLPGIARHRNPGASRSTRPTVAPSETQQRAPEGHHQPGLRVRVDLRLRHLWTAPMRLPPLTRRTTGRRQLRTPGRRQDHTHLRGPANPATQPLARCRYLAAQTTSRSPCHPSHARAGRAATTPGKYRQSTQIATKAASYHQSDQAATTPDRCHQSGLAAPPITPVRYRRWVRAPAAPGRR